MDLINGSETLVVNLLFLNKKVISHFMKNYINEELNATDRIIDIILENKNALSMDKLITHILKDIGGSNDINEILNTLNIFESRICSINICNHREVRILH